jgi:hypothetical protein
MFNSIIYERRKKILANYKIDFFYLDDYLLNILFEKKRNNNSKKIKFYCYIYLDLPFSNH